MTPGSAAPGLYLHIPFCSKICPYCDFAVTRGNRDAQRAFVQTLLSEFPHCADFPCDTPFDTIYFGGGTPSVLEPGEIATLIDAARTHLPIAKNARVTLEANPEDASMERLRGWRSLGVEGVSFGVQSLRAQELAFLGRRHSVEDAEVAVKAARAAGFEWISIDLIYGLPGQTLEQWQQNLELATALAPHHLSCYQLTIHENTPFHRREQRGLLQQLLDEDLGEFFRTTHETLAALGYPAYEISNFARSDSDRSRHNQKYWQHTPYLGVGPSAHSFDGTRRWWNLRDTAAYTQSLQSGTRPIEESEVLDAEQHALEAVMLALRTRDGLDTDDFRKRHGVDLEARNAALFRELRAAGLLAPPSNPLVLTTEGLAVVDGITPRLAIAP